MKRFLCYVLLGLSAIGYARADVVAPVAGAGPVGWDNGLFRGEGSPARDAYLNAPTGVAQDSAGRILIADYWNDQVRAVDPLGSILTVAGDGWPGNQGKGGALNTSLWGPWGVAPVGGGFVFTDTFNSSVRRVNADGTLTRIAGVISGSPGSQQDPYGGWSGYSGDGGAAVNARLNWPLGIAVDQSQNVYIADSWNQRIRRINGGIITTVAGNGRADSWGRGDFGGDGGPATTASLNWPTAVAVDAQNNLYIADTYNQRIRRVDSATGNITTFAGNGQIGDTGDGGPATEAALNFPSGIAVAPNGTLYIADSMNHRIRAVANGVITNVAGTGQRGLSGDNGPALEATFNEPRGLALTNTGDLLVADTGNNRVRMVILGRTGTVSGVIRDMHTLQPIPSAQVAWNGVMAAADAQGRYSIITREGYMSVTAGAPTYGAVTDTVGVNPGAVTTHDFLLPSGQVAGRVVDDGGHIVPGATVLSGDVSVTTGPDGGFRMRLAPGIHTVTAGKDSYGSASLSVNVQNGQDTDALLVIYRLHPVIVPLGYDKDWISPHDKPADFTTPSRDFAFPAEELPNSLSVFSIPTGISSTISFLFPDKANGANNALFVNGQTLTVPSGRYAGLHMLEAAQFGSWDGVLRLNYTDGSVSLPLRFADWAWSAAGQHMGDNETVAISTSHRHRGGNPDGSPPVDIMHSYLPVDPTRTLVSVTLPPDPQGVESRDGYIFALSLDGTGAAQPYGDVDGNSGITVTDARMVLQAAAGLRVLALDQAVRADVWPVYGLNAFGDGQATLEDALAILRRALAPA